MSILFVHIYLYITIFAPVITLERGNFAVYRESQIAADLCQRQFIQPHGSNLFINIFATSDRNSVRPVSNRPDWSPSQTLPPVSHLRR